MSAHTIHGVLVDVSVVKGNLSQDERESLVDRATQMLEATPRKSFHKYLDANKNILQGNSKIHDFTVIKSYLRPIDEYVASRYERTNEYGYIDSVPMVEVNQSV